MSIDSIGNFLTIIRNGTLVAKSYVYAPYSALCHSMASIFKDEGFIRDVSVQDVDGKKKLKIFLKYYEGESVIHEIKRVSLPSRRVYSPAKAIKPVAGKLGLSVLTTSKGVMSHKKAKNLGVGGEVICTVW